MKKIKALSLILALSMSVAAFAGCSKKEAKTDVDAIKEKKTLIVGMTEYEPMNFKDANGKWTGFDTEFAQAVAEKLGAEAQFIEVDWDNKYAELDAKSIDCIWNGMTITEEGRLNASISTPYVKNAQVVVMAKDKLDQYKDAESMKDLKFAVETGSAGEKAAKDAGFKNITAVATQSDTLLEVSSGAADASIIDITMAISMTGETSSYANLGYKVELTTEEYGIAFRKNSNLTHEVNKIMAEFMKDGTLDALAKKYNLTLIK